ncbi:MAG TPA: putative Ig domain-containing protein [Acidimicrobiales bacterium]|nr:putative Ig domain-containing protein [Acidimicrobiales bacterium]
MRRNHRISSGRGVLLAIALCLVGCLIDVAPVGAATLSSIAPSSGVAGTTVTLSGSGFSGASLSATVGGESTPVVVTSNTTATFVVPTDLAPGAQGVTIFEGGVAQSRSFTFTILQVTSTLTDGEVGVNSSQKVIVVGGRSPYAWSVVSGSIPSGLSLSSGGVLSGTPKVAGTSVVTVQATDANGASAQFSLTVIVDPGPSILTAALPPATIGTQYVQVLAASGGAAPLTWSIQSGGLPGGLILSSTGILSGRPGALGSFSIALRVTDGLGSIVTKSFPILVRPASEAMALLTGSGAIESISTFTAAVVSLAPVPGAVTIASSLDGTRSWVSTARGVVVPLPGAPALGGLARAPRRPIVAMAARPDGTGYWLVTAAGRVYGFGTAHAYGSVQTRLVGRVVGIASTRNGRGYVVVTSKGHLYRFGNAPRLSSPRSGRLRGSAVGVALTLDGKGAFIASSRGIVLGVGTARTEKIRTPPVPGAVQAIVPVPSGYGYWLVTATGAVVPAGGAEALSFLPVPPGAVLAAASAV